MAEPSPPALGGGRFYLALAAMYALSRAALLLFGVRFHADYGWQYFHDLDLVTDRLWETLVYSHAFTPFLYLLQGVAHKLAGDHAPLVYQVLFLATGFGFTLAVGRLLLAVGIGERTALAATTLFCCTPAFIYFENFLGYEFPAAALLCFSLVLLRRALLRPRASAFFALFLVCALTTFVRTTFHLVWLLAMVAIALLFERRSYRAILIGAVLPVALVVGLYAKNQVMFGFFGASSWFAFNPAVVTTERLRRVERKRWIAEGKLHPVSGAPLYSGVDAYAEYLDLERTTGIPVLDRQRRANGRPNFNHWGYLEIGKLRAKDQRYYLRVRPRDYLATVASAYVDYFRPTTRWHPKDDDPSRSPHAENRQRLGGWENAYNAAVHGFPLAPFGLYLLLIALFAYALAAALRTVVRARFDGCTAEKLLLVMGFHALYVPVLSSFVTIGELERYRFLVEAPMWIGALWGAARLAQRLSTLRRSRWRAWAST